MVMRKHDKAIESGKLAVELDPNGAMVHGLLGNTLSYAGQVDEAIVYCKQAIRLNPFPAHWYFFNLGRCYRQKGQYEKALTAIKKAVDRHPGVLINHLALSPVYLLLNREEERRRIAYSRSCGTRSRTIRRCCRLSGIRCMFRTGRKKRSRFSRKYLKSVPITPMPSITEVSFSGI